MSEVILPPMARLSRDFYVWEACRSQTAREHGIEIVIHRDSVEQANAEALARKVLQPVRDRRDGPLNTTSWFRPPKVNRLVGGSETSQHTTAEAWDGYDGRGLTPFELAGEFLAAEVPFDQLILEHDGNVVHVSHSRAHNRGEVLTRYRDPHGGLAYVFGLHRLEDLA